MAARYLEFEQHVEVASGCWPWRGGLDAHGYGVYNHARAHRVAYLKWNDEIAPGFRVRHTCDNPPCVNPCHLILGTAADNSRDMVERGRSARGSRHSQAKLTESAVREIRLQLDAKVPPRQIADSFGIDRSTVSNIKTGKSWGWF